MKIGILSRNFTLYSTLRLFQECQNRGHETLIIDPLRCAIDITANTPCISYKGQKLLDYHAIIPRIGSSITFHGMAVVRQFEMMGVYPLNESNAIGRARDKLRSLQLLAHQNIPLPNTAFAHATQQTEELISMAGGAPVVVKLLEGSQGAGVVLGETKKAAESVIEAFKAVEANFLVQEFIKEAAGSDIRCFVIGDSVVAAMKRTAKEGDFRSNIHRGGSAEAVELTPEEEKIAVKAARIMGLNVAGVDMIRSNRGPLIIEVNSSPGLEGIEKATNINVAGLIVEFIEKNVRDKRARVKGRG
ncbi:MAG: 30S ribosomal protein S6--L-glutamate ligase [Bdellovibrio sp.]